MAPIDQVRQRLAEGLVIPACPLALDSRRRLDPRRQRALFRYYLAAGVGGLAVGVHTTQFAIRAPQVSLFRPVLELAIDEIRSGRLKRQSQQPPVAVGGICGPTKQAVDEAGLIRELGFDAGLLSLGALQKANLDRLLAHCRAVAEVLPVMGFYLQPAAGGRELPYQFWRRFVAIPNVVAIKIAPFNRYQTIDVVRAVAESGRNDLALYTGNDDSIVVDLLTPFRFQVSDRMVERRIVGGLLGQWAVWTRKAVELHGRCRQVVLKGESIPRPLMRLATALTDVNAAIFDAAHNFAGCIPGIHEVLRRQGLLEGIWCLDPQEGLSPGQGEEIERVCRAYPELKDDAFVARHRDEWLAG